MGMRAREGPAGDSDNVLRPGLLPLGDGRTPLDSRSPRYDRVPVRQTHRKAERGHVGLPSTQVRNVNNAVHPGAHEP
ncbi:hypothetical protein F1880_002556 [Penicillium rolfsii]|nr:hypothetical protein F1880_002556 [Penicillium rolfsii]